jgi:hypothetical protein
MAKISVYVEGYGKVQVEGAYVQGTDQKLFVSVSSPEGEMYVLRHTLTGYVCVEEVSKEEAVWMARQLFAACPSAWSREDSRAFEESLPHWVKEWVENIQDAAACKVPITLLKSCADFCREMESLAS